MVNIDDLKVIHHDSFADHRGELWTIYNCSELSGIFFNHDKIAHSQHNVLRGLHTDLKSYKLVTCLYGKIQFIAVNFDKSSKNYLKYQSFIIDSSSEIKTSILVPPKYLNGHLVLSDNALFHYKWAYLGNYPDIKDQISINWADPKINIDWLSNNPILSERDKNSAFVS